MHYVVLPGRAQTDGVGESIVYVSEPQPMAHTAEEVIDMVENPVTSEVSCCPSAGMQPHTCLDLTSSIFIVICMFCYAYMMYMYMHIHVQCMHT